LFADRLEIRSPGGLFSDVTLDMFEERQSTRNRRLMQVMEDLHLVDNRGSGIDKMITEMRDAHLEPPRFADDRSYFTVTFYSHTLMMSDEGVRWLNRVAVDLPVNDRQRLALLYLRHNARMTNSDYRRLHRVDSRVAGRELQGLVGCGAVAMKGVRGGAHYVLALAREVAPEPAAIATDEAKILAYVADHGSIGNAETRRLLGLVDSQKSWRLLRSLVKAGRLRADVRGRGSRYYGP
jgi:predicted HTH transcriptional regulator